VRTNVCSWGKSGRATDITAKTRFDPSATSKDAIGASPAERSDASLSFHIGRASVVALDINPNAAKVTAENAHANGLGKPIIAVGSNLLSALSPRPLFDVILSSPPSFAGEPLDVADRAWHAGPSYRDIAMLFIQARERLTSGGCMYVLFSTESDLDLLGSPAVRRHCRYPNLVRAAPPICPDIIFGKDREIIVKYAASLGKNKQSRIASHRLCRWLFSYLSVNQRLRASAIRSKATREAAARRRSPPRLQHARRPAIAALSRAGHRTSA
jgi:hypothetical protein